MTVMARFYMVCSISTAFEWPQPRWNANRDLVGGDIMSHDSASGCPAIGFDSHRSNQHGVAANESVITDGRFMLKHTIIIDSDHPRTDIYMGSNVRIANVTEMPDMRFGADPRVLHFAEVPHVDVVLQVSARSQMDKRPHINVIFKC